MRQINILKLFAKTVIVNILIAFSFASVNAMAEELETQWNWSFGVRYYLTPSGMRNKNIYEGNLLEGLLSKDISEYLLKSQREQYVDHIKARINLSVVNLNNQGSLARQSLQSELTEFYLDDKEILSTRAENNLIVDTSRQIRIGYFLSPWVEIERGIWSGYVLGFQQAGLWEHSAYNSVTQVGFDYGTILSSTSESDQIELKANHKKFITPQFQWKFGVLSGDGLKEQPMYQKDLYGVIQWVNENFIAGVGSQLGWYAGLPSNANTKQRNYIWLGQNNRELQWMLQGFTSMDAVDGLTQSYSVADGADFTSSIGTNVQGRGVGLGLTKSISLSDEKVLKINLRQDYINPNVHKAKTSEWGTQFGLSMPWRVGEVYMELSQFTFEENHSLNLTPLIYYKAGFKGTF